MPAPFPPFLTSPSPPSPIIYTPLEGSDTGLISSYCSKNIYSVIWNQSMVYYCRDMLPRRPHILDPLIESDIGPKCGKLWTDNLEVSFKEIKEIFSSDTLMNYLD